MNRHVSIYLNKKYSTKTIKMNLINKLNSQSPVTQEDLDLATALMNQGLKRIRNTK